MPIFYTPPCSHDKRFAFPKLFSYFLKFNGCWPTDGDEANFWFRCKNILYTVWGWFCFVNLSFVVYGQIAFFFGYLSNVALAVESLSTTMFGIMILLRTFHMRCSLNKLKKLLSVFADKIWINSKQHPRIVKQCQRKMLPSFILSLMLWGTLILYCFLPIIIFFTSHQTMESTDKGLPYRMLFPYDFQKGWYYFVTYLASMFAGYVTVSQFYALDVLMTFFVCYLCGQFDILHGDISRLIPECHAEWLKRYGGGGGCDVVGDGGDIVAEPDACSLRLLQDMYNKRLHKLSAHHNDLISFSVQLNDLVSFPLWTNIVNSTFLICFCAFQFVVSSNTACYLYACNWEGGQISENSPLLLQPLDMDSTTLSVKLPSWQYINYYPTDKDFQLKLCFMIMRSQRSIQLSGMKFTILSLESFSKIISSSMSYFTLLNTFLDKEK